MNSRAALAAAVAALTQQVTGLGTAVTVLAHQQNQQGPQPGRPGSLANQRPGSQPADGSGDGGPLGKVLGLASAKLMAFLAPLVAVGTVLGQTISGFGMLTAALKLISQTIAPFLLPVFVLLAAAIVAVSDELWEGIKNVLPQWYAWILQHGIPIFVQLVAAVRTVIDWFKKLSGTSDPEPEDRRPGAPIPGRDDPSGGTDMWHTQPGGGTPMPNAPAPGVHPDRIREEWRAIQDDVAAKTAEFKRQQAMQAKGQATADDVARAERDKKLAEGNRQRYLRGFDMDPNEARRHLDQGNVPKIRGADQQQPGTPGQQNPPGQTPPAPGQPLPGRPPGTLPPTGDARPTPGQRFNTAIRDVITSMRMQIGPPAQMLASGGVNRQAQMDLMKEDPLERRMRERSLAALEMLMQAIPRIEQNTAPRSEGFWN